MGCPSEVEIGDNLVFTVCTHDPDTGVLTDADAVPPYRVYEDETATAILTGNMAKLDDGNTTGFYSELIACTAANGFENGKSYTVYIEATVDSEKGGICYTFKAYDQRKTNVKKINDVATTSVTAINANVGTTQPINFTGTGASANVKTDLTMLKTSEQSATDIKDFADTGYDPSTHKVSGVVLTDTCTTNTDMRGTDSAALATALATAQTDLDTITGSDGAKLATLQPNQTVNNRTLNQQLKDVNVYVKGNVDSTIASGTQAFKDSDNATYMTYTIDANADRTVS